MVIFSGIVAGDGALFGADEVVGVEADEIVGAGVGDGVIIGAKAGEGVGFDTNAIGLY
jgi:hypothetical protein